MKRLILIRHAHRDKLAGRDADNGLSAKGRAQSRKILAHFAEKFPGARGKLPRGCRKLRVLSSPKLRCIETVAPIAHRCGLQVAIDPLLDEGGDLRRKIRDFESWWRYECDSPVLIACSHGDWLPEFIEELTRARVDLDKGAWAELTLDEEDSRPRLQTLLQAPGSGA